MENEVYVFWFTRKENIIKEIKLLNQKRSPTSNNLQSIHIIIVYIIKHYNLENVSSVGQLAYK